MEALRHLGLTGYESEIYKSLLQQGLCTAKQISEFSKVPPTAVYPNVKSLLQKGLIQEFEGDIRRYSVLDPKKAFKGFLAKRHAFQESMLEETLPELLSLQKIAPSKQKDAVQLSLGLQSSHNVTFEIFEHAKKELYILGWRFRQKKQIHLMLRKLREVAKRGVKVYLVLSTMDSTLFASIKEYSSSVQVRYFPVDNLSIVVCDNNECKLTLKSTELENRVNIHVKDSSLASFLQQYVEDIWRKAKPL